MAAPPAGPRRAGLTQRPFDFSRQARGSVYNAIPASMMRMNTKNGPYSKYRGCLSAAATARVRIRSGSTTPRPMSRRLT